MRSYLIYHEPDSTLSRLLAHSRVLEKDQRWGIGLEESGAPEIQDRALRAR